MSVLFIIKEGKIWNEKILTGVHHKCQRKKRRRLVNEKHC